MHICTLQAGGWLEDALDYYKCVKFGVKKAEVHIQNVSSQSFHSLHAFLNYIQICFPYINPR